MKTLTPEKSVAIIEYIRSHWGYNPMTGIVSGRLGKSIGTLRKDGALHCLVYPPGFTTSVLLHRAAWLLKTGKWPEFQIDHRDGNRTNNRWENLREATHSENRLNLSKVTAKGVLRGCTPYYRRWRAQIKVPGERVPRYLGLFVTQEEAHAAYCKAKAELHPFQPVQR